MLKSKSVELAKRLGPNDFKATDCWVSRWKHKFGIKFKNAHGKMGSADAVSAERWKYTKLLGLLKKFSSDDIYNAKETGVLYVAMLDASLSYRHVAVPGFKEQWII